MSLLLIPWFKLEAWAIPVPWLGTAKLQPFGLLAAVAIFVGSRCAERRAQQLDIPRELMSSFLVWTTAIGIVSAYVLQIVMYVPEELPGIFADPSRLLSHWYGLSSYGGFIGGTLAAVVFARSKHASLIELGDAWCYAIPFAWFFARMGCFVVHDHPGLASDFFLAVDDYNRSGIARHDLGLYEVLWSLAVAALFMRLERQPRPAGLYLSLIPLLYGPVRFGLDYLRASPIEGGDVRYLGLTPAQYLSLALTGIGVALLLRFKAKTQAHVQQA